MATADDLTRKRLDRRKLLTSAGAVGALGIAAGASAASAAPASISAGRLARLQDDEDLLVIAVDGSPSDLDPHSAYDYRSVMAILGAYEGLIGLVEDSTDQFEGLVAESWESNEDQSVWTFTIRPGISFHDGSPVNAEAVRLSFERFLTLGIGPVGVLSRFVDDPARITAPDDSTVVFDLGTAQPLFEAAMASTYGPLIVNAALLGAEHEEDGDWGHLWAQTNQEGCGCGPYRIVRFDPGIELEMEAYEGYWRGWDGAHFSRVIIRTVPESETRRQLLEQGEADIVDSLNVEAIEALEANPDITTMSQYVTRSDYFAFAIAEPLTSPEARQALCYAFPYTEVVEGVFGERGRQARGAVPDTIQGHDPETFQYTTDLDQARELLAAAGVAEGTTLSVAIESGIERDRATAELFQANLAEIGINLDIQQLDLPTMTAMVYGDSPPEERPNMTKWFWWPDYNDAWNHLYPQITCESGGSAGANLGFYCNARVDELMATASNAPDNQTYLDAIGEVQQIISFDDPSAIYYVEIPWTVQFRNEVTGIFINPINIGTYNFWSMQRGE
jgi:peptide/nickel transport system substrate-binding protein